MIRWMLVALFVGPVVMADELKPVWQTDIGGGRFEKNLAVSWDGKQVATHHHDDGGEDSFSLLKTFAIGDSKEPQAIVDLAKAGLEDVDWIFYLPGEMGLLVEDFDGPEQRYAATRWLLIDQKGTIQVKREKMGRFCLWQDEKGTPLATSFDHRVDTRDQSLVFEIRPLELPVLKPGRAIEFRVSHEHLFKVGDQEQELIGWLDCGLKRVTLTEGKYDPHTDKTIPTRLFLTNTATGKVIAQRDVEKRELAIISRFLHALRPTTAADRIVFRGLPGAVKSDDPWKEHQALTLGPDLQIKPVDLALPRMADPDRPVRLLDYSSKRCVNLGVNRLICLMRYSRQKIGPSHQHYDVLALDLASGRSKFAGRLDTKDDGDVFFAAGSDRLLVTVRNSRHGWRARSAEVYSLSD